MAIQLKKMGENNFKVIIVDAHPMNIGYDKTLMPTFGEKFQSYRLLVKQKNWKEVFQRSFYKFRAARVKFESVLDTRLEKANKPAENLKNIQKALKKVYKKYEWKPFDFKITLILAGNFETHPWSKTVIAQWENLARKGVEYSFVKGSHMSLFDEPDVRELGKGLQQILDENPENNVETSAE
jgi:thioesterase domain-containing protein